jgi:hypothetical protein
MLMKMMFSAYQSNYKKLVYQAFILMDYSWLNPTERYISKIKFIIKDEILRDKVLSLQLITNCINKAARKDVSVFTKNSIKETSKIAETMFAKSVEQVDFSDNRFQTQQVHLGN